MSTGLLALLSLLPIISVVIFLVMLRSEEHTSELQSRRNLVCRLLLEKKKVLWYIFCNVL